MQTDLLAECNHLQAPAQDFTAAFCSRCRQQECSRSTVGKSMFEARIATWEQRLFTNVLRLDPKDKRYQEVNARNFLMVDPTQKGSPAAWVDPKDVEATKAFSFPTPEVKPQLAEAPVVSAGGLVNTPNRPGQMLGGAPPTPSKVQDPWGNPAKPSQTGEVVVKPGAKIKLGP